MGWLGMLFVGAVMGFVASRYHPTMVEVKMRIWVMVGALSAFASGVLGQVLAGFNIGSMRGTLIVLLGACLGLVLVPIFKRGQPQINDQANDQVPPTSPPA